jgi:23S rRNA pseudouridine955/2504/2580 synthase
MSWNAGQVVNLPVSADEDDTRLDRWLKRKFHGLNQIQIEKALRKGEIRVDGGRAKSSTRLKAGQSVRVPPMQTSDAPQTTKVGKVSGPDADFIQSLVIHEDDEIIVLNKPAGIAVQGGTGTKRHLDTMTQALVAEGEDKPRLVHRLDRDTSGILVLAKTLKAAAGLGHLFKSRELDKIYWAVTVGVPHPLHGELRSWMIKSTGPGEDKEKMRVSRHGEPGAVHAVTLYTVVANAGPKAAWVALKPETGRTHQLRFHMAEMGTQILGDRKYTTPRETPGGLADGLHLHARALRLPPMGNRKRELKLVAELPEHMEETFGTLGFDAGSVSDPFFELKRIRRR